MGDAEAGPVTETPTSGGPSWLHSTRGAPASVSPAPPTMMPGAAGGHGPRPGSADEMFTARYNRNGSSPLPFLVVALVGIGAAWWALDWARWTPDSPERFQTNEWWVNVTSVLVPGEYNAFGA